jgi:hypothetical protein
MKQYTRLIPILFLLNLLIPGCNKDLNENQPPIAPEDKEFDLTNDSKNDFKLNYLNYTWDGIGPDGTGFGIAGLFIPIDNNKILKNQNSGILFSNVNDTIKNQVELPYSWISSISEWPSLVEIKTYINQWEKTWTIKSPDIKEFYYLAFKIFAADKEILGWLKLKIDNKTGSVEVIEKNTTDRNFIVISK